MQHLPTTRKTVCKMRDRHSLLIVAAVEASDVLLSEVSARKRIVACFGSTVFLSQVGNRCQPQFFPLGSVFAGRQFAADFARSLRSKIMRGTHDDSRAAW